MKFYHAHNCNRYIVAGKHPIQFIPYEYVGTWMGVYATPKEPEITALDALVQAGKIESITEKEYRDALKKKGMATEGYSGSLAATTPTPGAVAPSVAPAAVKTVAPEGMLESSAPTPPVTMADAITAVPVQPKTPASA